MMIRGLYENPNYLTYLEYFKSEAGDMKEERLNSQLISQIQIYAAKLYSFN